MVQKGGLSMNFISKFIRRIKYSTTCSLYFFTLITQLFFLTSCTGQFRHYVEPTITILSNSTTASPTPTPSSIPTPTPAPVTISSVTSTTAGGTYAAGANINITINFSETVIVTGTPQIVLNTTPNRSVNYVSGSGTAALVYTYTVQAGDVDAHVDYLSTSALTLNGGTIKNASGIDATLTLPATGGSGLYTNNIVITASPADLIDDDNSALGFAGGTFTGVEFNVLTDGSSNGLKLANNGGCDGTLANCAGGLSTAAHAGLFISRVFDALNSFSWDSVSWSTTLPFFKALPDYSGSIQNETSATYSSLVGTTQSTGDNDLMSGIVRLWHLDETVWNGTPNEVIDSSGQNSHGASVNAVTTSNGRFGGGGSFNGINQYLDMPIINTSLYGGLTISAWIKPTDITTNPYYEIIRQAGGPDFLFSFQNNGTVLSFGIATAVGGYSEVDAPIAAANFTDGLWHHVVATYDMSFQRVYVDGVQIGFSPKTGAMDVSGASMEIGHAPPGNEFFNGLIDEVAVWSRPLGAVEIRQLYQRGASRIKFQVRSCSDYICSPAPAWIGPDGTTNTYFSELFNTSVQSATPSGIVNKTGPVMTFSNFTSPPTSNKYFQYQAIFESDSSSTALMPELKTVTAIGH